MTESFDPYSYFARLDLPPQDLAKLSFCGSPKSARLQAWINQLQATRISHTSIQLYRALPDVARLKTNAQTRLEMLEILRPAVQNNIAGLAKDFLGQPLILPEAAQKAAIIAQALQKGMINGYSQCVASLLAQKKLSRQDRDILAMALYRATYGIGALYLRTCQIYTQLPSGLWLHLHQLFRAAEYFELTDTPVQDSLLPHRRMASTRDSYARTILLACSRPNQLSQHDLKTAYHAFDVWASAVALSDDVVPDNGNPFIINLSRDEAPTYKERFNGDEDDHLLELDFSRLLTGLEGQQQKPSAELTIPKNLSAELVQHLTHAWKTVPDRQQHRRKVKTVVDICIGLSECHYHLAGGKDFPGFLAQWNRREDGGWEDIPDFAELGAGFTPSTRKQQTDPHQDSAPTRVHVQNVSAGGYCLYWQESIPAHATTGQLLGIREAGKKQWHLAIIRWVRQLKGASQMGVQTLALDAKPAAASLVYDLGGCSDPMRVLLVPPSHEGKSYPTLITAAVPFQAFSRIRLQTSADTRLLTLDQSVYATDKIRQFRYQQLSADAEASDDAVSGVTPDSCWD
jgi:hypothetical protein